MGFQLGEDHDSGMNEMNLIPLIDIMLVLMIIFLVTATVANPSIPLSLPKTTAEIIDPPAESVQVSINANGEVAWDTQVISLDELQKRFQEAGQGDVPGHRTLRHPEAGAAVGAGHPHRVEPG